MNRKVIETGRLILRPFRGTDLENPYEFLSRLENDEFEGYPGITRENSVKYLNDRIGSKEFYAIELKQTGRVIGYIYPGDREYRAMSAHGACRRKPVSGGKLI